MRTHFLINMLVLKELHCFDLFIFVFSLNILIKYSGINTFDYYIKRFAYNERLIVLGSLRHKSKKNRGPRCESCATRLSLFNECGWRILNPTELHCFSLLIFIFTS